jgi:hypothetical protein
MELECSMNENAQANLNHPASQFQLAKTRVCAF